MRQIRGDLSKALDVRHDVRSDPGCGRLSGDRTASGQRLGIF